MKKKRVFLIFAISILCTYSWGSSGELISCADQYYRTVVDRYEKVKKWESELKRSQNILMRIEISCRRNIMDKKFPYEKALKQSKQLRLKIIKLEKKLNQLNLLARGVKKAPVKQNI